MCWCCDSWTVTLATILYLPHGLLYDVILSSSSCTTRHHSDIDCLTCDILSRNEVFSGIKAKQIDAASPQNKRADSPHNSRCKVSEIGYKKLCGQNSWLKESALFRWNVRLSSEYSWKRQSDIHPLFTQWLAGCVVWQHVKQHVNFSSVALYVQTSATHWSQSQQAFLMGWQVSIQF